MLPGKTGKIDIMDNCPLVSIGLPVYNGENFLEQCIQSILKQTFKNFELIIVDNASTDMSEEICQSYAQRDKRIRYFRNPENIGAARNFNMAFHKAVGKYFKWAAHDDLLDESFLEKCVSILENDEKVVLCFSKVQIIDEKQNILRKYDISLENSSSLNPQQRYGDVILTPHSCFEVFGLMRNDILKCTSLIASHVSSDRNLLAEIILYGTFYYIPECLFYSRDHQKRSVKASHFYSLERALWFDPRNKNRFLLTQWKVIFKYLKPVFQTNLKLSERIGCMEKLFQLIWKQKKILVKDISLFPIHFGYIIFSKFFNKAPVN